MAVLAPTMPVLAWAVTLVACGAASPSDQRSLTTAVTARPPRSDVFHGRITAATGALAHERGDVTVVLSHPRRGGNTSTSLTLSIRAAGCGGQTHCLRLNGHLSGRMTLQHSLPDVGHRFEIGARGTVTPLGHVEASGTAAGTGFIRTGHTGLSLVLRSASGKVTVDGQSGSVPGRTDP
jgi:hypothetical protein